MEGIDRKESTFERACGFAIERLESFERRLYTKC